MNRRQFIKSILSGGVLALGGVGAFQWYQQASLDFSDDLLNNQNSNFLTQDDRLLLSVLIPVMVNHSKTNPDIGESIRMIDGAISRLPFRTQAELRDLLDLLASGLGRFLVAGVWLNWQKASDQQIESFLLEWRDSALTLLQQAYIGLHQLIIGSVYAQPDSWLSIGYPGPPRLYN